MNEHIIRPLQRVAGVCLAMLMLCGCVQQKPHQTTLPPETTQTTEPTAATKPTEPAPPETEPPITEPPVLEQRPTLDPVTKLACTRWRTHPELLSLGGGIVLASRNYFSPEDKAIINSMELVDVYGDTVVATLINDSTREPVLQRFPDGAIVMADPNGNKFYVYDGALQLLDSFSAPKVDGFFSYDRKNYYFVDNDVLYRMDVESGNRGRMTLEQDLRLESLVSIHPTEDLLVAQVYLSPYTSDCGIAVINAKNGKLRLLSDQFSHMWFTGDTFYGVRMNDDVYGYDVYYGALSGGEVHRITTDVLGGDTVGYGVLPGSHLLLRRLAPDEGERNTTIFDIAKGGVAADLNDYGFADATFGAVYLAEEQLILGFYANGYDFDPVLIDPVVLTYGEGVSPEKVQWTEPVDQTVAEQYFAELNGPELPADLTDARAQADAIEEKYNVTVLIGEQTALTGAHSGYVVQTESDAGRIKTALEQLDAALALYPEGFLKQLRNGAGEGGLYICLTGKIEGELDTVGFARLNRDRYNLVLDITAAELEKTIHHELWHAIEMKISTDTFDTNQWNACNPAGFTYYGNYDKGYLDLTRWTYTEGSGADSYFVDPYSRINGREDRARIMEYVMSADATELMKASAIQKKLQIMSDAIRRSFDTKGWDQVYWERYL